jgi:hypothetical protein
MLPIARLDFVSPSIVNTLTSAGTAASPRAAATPEPSFELLVDEDASVRAVALRALVGRRDPSLFVVICAGEAIDEVFRRRADLPAAPLTWRGWRGVVPGLILAMAPDERLAWAVEFADKLIETQRYPASLVASVRAAVQP